MASSSISGPSKRQRGATSGSQQVPCLVDGCNSDLSKCRDYHRRHKVCELHAKTAQVIIRGLNQRFCQQCSRFHSLEEFDEGKRSCRKRLDGHNRRRRKPQPEPLRTEPHASILCSYQGSGLLPFQGELSIKTEADSRFLNQYYRVNLFHKQYPFNESSSSTGRGCEGGGESVNPRPLLPPPMAFPVNGDCALSLLSSPTTLPSPTILSRISQPALQHPLRYNSLQPIPMDSDHPSTFKNDEFDSPSFPSLWDQ